MMAVLYIVWIRKEKWKIWKNICSNYSSNYITVVALFVSTEVRFALDEEAVALPDNVFQLTPVRNSASSVSTCSTTL